MQYTLRNIPSKLHEALRARARLENKDLNQVVVEILAAALEGNAGPRKYRDLSDVAGTWVEDPVFEEIRREHDQIDPELWK